MAFVSEDGASITNRPVPLNSFWPTGIACNGDSFATVWHSPDWEGVGEVVVLRLDARGQIDGQTIRLGELGTPPVIASDASGYLILNGAAWYLPAEGDIVAMPPVPFGFLPTSLLWTELEGGQYVVTTWDTYWDPSSNVLGLRNEPELHVSEPTFAIPDEVDGARLASGTQSILVRNTVHDRRLSVPRVRLRPMTGELPPMPDAGSPPPDAVDAGAPDAGPPERVRYSCGCRIPGRAPEREGLALALFVVIVLADRRRRRCGVLRLWIPPPPNDEE